MATKSILKNIYMSDPEQISRLADAMEKAEAWQGKEVELRYPVVELKGQQIKDFVDAYLGKRRGVNSRRSVCSDGCLLLREKPRFPKYIGKVPER
ncbi:MAG: hypothetical protein IJS96_04055 [Schwartzia sp.]|nr:hypothetical protein [Schwartzia sp. (in: firmicutes)]